MKTYVLKIMCVGVFSIIIQCILPTGNIKKYALFAVSVILTLCLISPLSHIKNIDYENTDFTFDYQLNLDEAVLSVVRSVKGFEKSDVSIKYNGNNVDSITVKTNNDKLLEETTENIHKDYLVSLLSSLYRTENIYFEN